MERSQVAGVTDIDNDYQISMEASTRHFRISAEGIDIAQSKQVKVLYETRLPPVYYFPKEDVETGLLQLSNKVTHCPFRGNATHWHLKRGDIFIPDIAWSYETPLPDAGYIKDHIAFYADKIDPVSVDDIVTVAGSNPAAAHPNPLVNWLVNDACNTTDPEDLIQQFAHCLVNAGYPVFRFFLSIRLLHPQLQGTGYIWTRQDNEIQVNQIPHETLLSDQFLKSPIRPILDGAGGIRRRLQGPNAVIDYPILEELQAEGATDYVAMPMTFSNGQINVLSLASDQAAGFSTQQLGHLYEILPLLSRLFEVFSSRAISSSLLDTYLGSFTGRQVLEGKIKRGDGENINAIIWFCDLRESTSLAESLSRPDFLAVLNCFFDCVAGAVLEHHGEILRFIGDAALAIFPIGDRSLEGDDCSETEQIFQAGNQAIDAALMAQEKMAETNAERASRREKPLKFGLGMHLGEVTYGNIGTASRLEFTVIGAAANEAARIESMCKTLGHTILVSSTLANVFPQRFKSVGKHKLRGVKSEQELFTLQDK